MTGTGACFRNAHETHFINSMITYLIGQFNLFDEIIFVECCYAVLWSNVHSLAQRYLLWYHTHRFKSTKNGPWNENLIENICFVNCSQHSSCNILNQGECKMVLIKVNYLYDMKWFYSLCRNKNLDKLRNTRKVSN